MEKINFKKNDIVFSFGDTGKCMYSVVSGKIGIYSNYGQPGERLLVELGEGKFFGEMAVIDDMPRSATAKAHEDTVLSEIGGADLQQFVSENPDSALVIIRSLSGRLRGITNDYMEACKTLAEIDKEFKPAKEGLGAKIKKFAKVFAESADYASIMGGDGSAAAYYSYISSIYPFY